LVGHKGTSYRIARRWQVQKRDLDMFGLGFAVFDQHGGDAFGNFALLID
jgi:hypothetical protein